MADKDFDFKYGINKFELGMRNDADPDDLPVGYSALIKNLTLAKRGSLRTRKGYNLIGTEETGTGKVQGLGFRVDTYGNPEWWRIIEGKAQYLNFNTLFNTGYLSSTDIDQSATAWTSPSSASSDNGFPASLQVTMPALAPGEPLASTFITQLQAIDGSTLLGENKAGNLQVNMMSYRYDTIGGSADLFGINSSALTDTIVNSTTFGFRICFDPTGINYIDFKDWVFSVPGGSIISGIDVQIKARIRIYDQDPTRMRDLVIGEIPLGTYLYIIELDSLIARVHYFLPPAWTNHGAGKTHLFEIRTVHTSSTGSTLQVTSAITSPEYYIGAIVHNLDRDEFRYITGQSSTTVFTVNKPIGDSWDGDQIIVMDEVSMVNYRDKMYMASSSRGGDGFTISYFTPAAHSGGLTTMPGGKFLATHGLRLFIGRLDVDPTLAVFTHVNSDNVYDVEGTAAADADVAGANTITSTASIFTSDMVGSLIYAKGVTDYSVKIRTITGYTSPTVITTDGSTALWNNTGLGIISNYFRTERPITGAVGFDNYILLFDSKDAYQYNVAQDSVKVFRNRGCLSHRSIAINNDGVAFHSNAEGVYMTPPAGVPTKVSSILRNNTDNSGLLDSLPTDKYPLQAGGILNDDYILSCFDLTASFQNQDIDDTTVVYNFPQNNFRVYDYPANIYVTGSDVNSKEITYFGDYNSNNVFELNSSDKDWDISTNEWRDIPFEVIFHPHSANRPDLNKILSIVVVKYFSVNPVTVMIKRDDEAWQLLTILPASPYMRSIEITSGKRFEYIATRFFGEGEFELSSIIFKGNLVPLNNQRY